MVVIINPFEKSKVTIVNDYGKLKEYFSSHSSQIWAGFNSRHYDVYLLKAALLDFKIQDVNDWIICQGKDGWQFSDLFNKVKVYNFDIMPNPPVSLKTLEAFMGSNIKETDVPFDINRPLTKEEIEQTVLYCTHDVEQTMEVFMHRREEFDSRMALVSQFKLPFSSIGKTEAQLVSEILGCRKREFNDEWDIQVLPTIRLKKYKWIADWYLDPENHDYNKKLTVDVAGVPHVFAWGGLHGARKKYHSKGLMLHIDVSSYYPTLLIVYKIITRAASNPELYEWIYNYRLKLKAQGKKKEQTPYKKMLNAISGAMKDRFNPAYDPRNNNLMCINGQLMLLDLIEKLEDHCLLIQSNTDGLIVEIEDTQEAFELIDDICWEWEARTGMRLSLDVISEIYQGDVNNYLWIEEDGTVERIGAYLKELSPLDYDLPIINEALVNYMVNGVPVEKTIGECDELIKYQKVVKVSKLYYCGWHNGQDQHFKTFRVFASKDPRDTMIGKKKRPDSKPEKYANTPQSCFLFLGNSQGVKCPEKLDKQWYIDLAKKRLLEKFGVTV